MSTYEISKSSLLSLKAEILRKQDEVTKAKLQNKAKSVQESRKSTPLELKNKGVTERSKFDEVEDEDLLKKSRDVLEAKSKLYEQLVQGKKKKGSERFLVQFGRKLTNAKPPDDSNEEDDYDHYPESDEERHFSDEYEPAKNREDEWVEYTDCLGRTRKCLRKDLEHIKEKDVELKKTIKKKQEKSDDKIDEIEKNEEKIKDNDIKFDENSELLSNDMRTELLRQKWEKEEEELTKKSDVHYQDILFDEARVHGVGYYGFSKDERQRTRQQEALKKLREETQREQQKAEDKKKLRDAQLAARAKAARNRKRERMGLPPEEESEQTDEVIEKNLEDNQSKSTPQEIEADRKREEQRKRHIRPWDIGKEGVKEELTQEEWVYKKRRERNDEFAPPKAYNERKKRVDNKFKVDTSKPPPKINNPAKKLNPYKEKTQFQRRPIINECSDSNSDSDELMRGSYEEDKRGKGVEIAPPPTFDYYGPSLSKKLKTSKPKEDIAESITAGLQFLRQQSEKKGRNRDDDMFVT
nr:coiled-coil domain-containing protein 174 [Onthophagus taurus]